MLCRREGNSSSYSVFIRCFPLSRDGRIHPIPSAIACLPSLHWSRFWASYFFKLIFCCFLLFLLLPALLRSSSLFLVTHFNIESNPQITMSFLFSTCPYHLTPFALSDRSIVFLNPKMTICSSVVFLSTTI